MVWTAVKLVKKVSIEFIDPVFNKARLYSFTLLQVKSFSEFPKEFIQKELQLYYNKILIIFVEFVLLKIMKNNYTAHKISNMSKYLYRN